MAVATLGLVACPNHTTLAERTEAALWLALAIGLAWALVTFANAR